jgi:hypothetical protein
MVASVRNGRLRRSHVIPVLRPRSNPTQPNRNTTMNTCDAANVRATSVAFTNCFDATTFGQTVYMTAHEESRVRDLLAALQDFGFVLRASFAPVLPGYGSGDAVGHLRTTIGAPIVDAALAAGDSYVSGSDPAPAAVMPVWEFEPEGGSGDVLVSSARLLPGHERGARWSAGGLNEKLREAQPLASHLVEPRRRRAAQRASTVTTQIAVADVVGEDEDDVRLALCGRRPRWVVSGLVGHCRFTLIAVA